MINFFVLLILIETKHNSKKLLSTSRAEEINLLFIANKTPPPLIDELDKTDLSHLYNENFENPSSEEFMLLFNQVSVKAKTLKLKKGMLVLRIFSLVFKPLTF